MRMTLRDSMIEHDLVNGHAGEVPWRPHPAPISRVQQRKSQQRIAYLKSTVVQPRWWLTVLSGLPPRQTRMETMSGQPYSIDLIWTLEARLYAQRMQVAERDMFPTPFDAHARASTNMYLATPVLPIPEAVRKSGYDPVAFLGDAEAAFTQHHNANKIHIRRSSLNGPDAAAPGAGKHHFGYAVDGPGAWHNDSRPPSSSRRPSATGKNQDQQQPQLRLPFKGGQQSRFSHSTRASDVSSAKRFTIPEPLKSLAVGQSSHLIVSAQTAIHSAPVSRPPDEHRRGGENNDNSRPTTRSLSSLHHHHDDPPHDVAADLLDSPWAEQFGKSPRFSPVKPHIVDADSDPPKKSMELTPHRLRKSDFVEELGSGGGGGGGGGTDGSESDGETWDHEDG